MPEEQVEGAVGGRHSRRGKKVKSTLTYDVVSRIVKQMTE